MGKVSIRKTKNNSNTLIVTEGDKEIRLHSAYDPEKEAERSVSTFNKGRASIIIISGLALAYHVHEIKKKYTDITIVVHGAPVTYNDTVSFICVFSLVPLIII